MMTLKVNIVALATKMYPYVELAQQAWVKDNHLDGPFIHFVIS